VQTKRSVIDWIFLAFARRWLTVGFVWANIHIAMLKHKRVHIAERNGPSEGRHAARPEGCRATDAKKRNAHATENGKSVHNTLHTAGAGAGR